jgi:hypothetical protein
LVAQAVSPADFDFFTASDRLQRYLQNSKGSGHQLHIKRKELPWFGLERPKDVEQTI